MKNFLLQHEDHLCQQFDSVLGTGGDGIKRKDPLSTPFCLYFLSLDPFISLEIMWQLTLAVTQHSLVSLTGRCQQLLEIVFYQSSWLIWEARYSAIYSQHSLGQRQTATSTSKNEDLEKFCMIT